MAVNSQQYVNNTLEPFFKQLTEEEKCYEYLQEGNTPQHSIKNLMLFLWNESVK
jgi:hypothetical protein